ncbi:MAG: thioredoxin [Lentisphaeria bacterium]
MKILTMAGVILVCGAVGFGWAKLVGCPSGGCPLTATPWRGAVVGLVLGSLLAISLLRRGDTTPAMAVLGEDAIVQVADQAGFATLLDAGKPVLVDFYADWCGPCRRFGPAVATVADRHRADLTVAKVNVDSCSELARKYGVSSIPAIFLFRNGKPVKQVVGAMSVDELEAWTAN